MPRRSARLALIGPAPVSDDGPPTGVNRLAPHFPVLFTAQGGLVAHECILDLRPLTRATGITVDDVVKRLIDYGVHAPTMSFPVAGTFMVEPTESEDLGEIDRFCDAMIAIRAEIDKVGSGQWPQDDNPLVNAPHTAQTLIGDWGRPYSWEEAIRPAATSEHDKYWPPCGASTELTAIATWSAPALRWTRTRTDAHRPSHQHQMRVRNYFQRARSKGQLSREAAAQSHPDVVRISF